MEQVSTFGARLRALMEEQGETYLSLAQRLKMNPQTLNRYVLGQRSPKVTSAAAIAGALGVNPLWLQGYDAPKYTGLPPQVPAIPPKPEALVPILGSIRAGIPALAQQDIQGYAPADVPMPEEYFYLRVDGDSMIGAGIRPGDLVLMRRQEAAESGQIVACLVDGEAATLKRFRQQGDMIMLQPENPDYEPRFLSAHDFELGNACIVGVAVRLVRDL